MAEFRKKTINIAGSRPRTETSKFDFGLELDPILKVNIKTVCFGEIPWRAFKHRLAVLDTTIS